MKIAHITSTFPPYEAGTGRVCFYNALELARLGHDVTVFAPNYPPGAVKYPADITVCRLPVVFRLGNAPLMPGLLKLRGFDIIHLHYPFIFGAELVWLAATLSRTPYVITHHNDLAGKGPRNLLFRVYFPLSRWLVARRARKYVVVALGHAEHCGLTPVYRRRWQDVVEVHNGVDIEIFRPGLDGSAVRQQYAIPHDAPLITFVGALDRAHLFKGVERLLEAFVRLHHSEARLMIIGDGEMRPEYEAKAAALGIADRVTFTGKVRHEELGACYAASDIVVLPSTPPESFGMVLIEAGACARPVIASDIPGVRSVVEDGQTGLLVHPGDIDDLVAKIGILLADPDLRVRMGQCGHDRAVSTYTWAQAALKLEALYTSLVKRPGTC